MTEKEVKELKFGETVKGENGDRYTRTIGGWIYSNFAGHTCFIPDIAKNETTERIVKKDVKTK